MAQSRKDHKGRVLRKGETQRKSDLMYVYTYTDIYSHKRKYVYAKDLLKLREKEKNLIRDQLDGLDVYVAGNADLNFLFERYISTKTNIRSTTLSNYIYSYNHFVRDTLGKRKICSIRYSDVLHFYLRLMQERGIKIRTVETVHTLLYSTFQMGVRDGIIRSNPCEGAYAQLKERTGQTAGVRHALTIEEQRAFMNYTVNSPVFYHWAPLFTVILGTGCRIGEVIGLRWDDIDYDKRMISINHSVSYYPRRTLKTSRCACEYKVSLPKTDAGIRNIPMIDEVYNAFKEEAERQEDEGIYNIDIVDGMSGFIFCNRYGKMLNQQVINMTIRRIYENYNAEELLNAAKQKREPIIIPHFTCHHLRHTFCTRFCENETNVKVIQAVMGHANIRTTLNIYAEVTDAKKKEAIEKLAENMKIF